MTATEEKTEAEQIEVLENPVSSQVSDDSVKKGAVKGDGYLPNEARDEDVVTLKTWMVIVVSTFPCYISVPG